MEAITTVLVLLLAVIVSGVISQFLPVPRPLVQIAFGAMIGLVPGLGVPLNPGVFFVLFLPPLLFLDGWRIPKEELLKDRATVLELALGLVVVTVIGVGFFIHWMLPAMPLAIAFALAAVVSPTDPIAVSAIARRMATPRRLMHILEGEALLNDASGLVCFQFAVTAMLTGTFSLTDAGAVFIWLSLGGIAIGTATTMAIVRAKDWISRRIGEETGSQVLISLLIPFASYLLAEHLHCSGILAAVAAGVTMSFAENSGRALGETRMQRDAVWDMVQFAANGMIFVLLGEQLPDILAGAAQSVSITGHTSPLWLVVYVLAISIVLAVLRFAWVWLSLQLTLFRGSQPTITPTWRIVAVTTVAGVRGTVTLAGILTLPLILNDGSPLPARELAIFLATGVIAVTLLTGTIALPRLLQDLQMPTRLIDSDEENAARIAASEAAISAIEQLQHERAEGRSDADLFVAAAWRTMELYRRRIEDRTGTVIEKRLANQISLLERELGIAGLKAERAEIFRRLRRQGLSDQIARKLVREIDLMEARLFRQS